MIDLETIKDERYIVKIASDYGVHQSVIYSWKKDPLDG